MTTMQIIHISFAKVYKYKSLIIDWHACCEPTFLRHKDHKCKDMRRVGLRQWGEFTQWYNLPDTEKEKYRI